MEIVLKIFVKLDCQKKLIFVVVAVVMLNFKNLNKDPICFQNVHRNLTVLIRDPQIAVPRLYTKK